MTIDEPTAAAGVGDEVRTDPGPVRPSDAISRAHRPVTKLAGPYGHPFHPILVTLPIGAWVIAVVFDVASHVSNDPRTFAPAAFWLVVVGLAGALVAAVFGFIDMLATSPGSKARQIALIHMALNLTVVVLFAATLPSRRHYVEHSPSPLFRDHKSLPTSWSAFAVSVAALVLLGASGWLGGRLSYRYGVRVADESDQAEGLVPRAT